MKIKNLLRAVSAATLILTCTLGLNAQDDNLVPNGGFEDTNIKKLKSYGQMEEFCMDWFAATDVPADVFGEGAKGDKVGIPENNYGTQDAATGLCYAGFRAYSKDPKLKRSYIEVKLPNTLEKNVMYSTSAMPTQIAFTGTLGGKLSRSPLSINRGSTILYASRRRDDFAR